MSVFLSSEEKASIVAASNVIKSVRGVSEETIKHIDIEMRMAIASRTFDKKRYIYEGWDPEKYGLRIALEISDKLQRKSFLTDLSRVPSQTTLELFILVKAIFEYIVDKDLFSGIYGVSFTDEFSVSICLRGGLLSAATRRDEGDSPRFRDIRKKELIQKDVEWLLVYPEHRRVVWSNCRLSFDNSGRAAIRAVCKEEGNPSFGRVEDYLAPINSQDARIIASVWKEFINGR